MSNIQYKPSIAYTLALLAHLCYCSQNYFIKQAQRNLTPAQVQYFSFLQLGIYTYFIAPYRKVPLNYKNPKGNKLLLIRSLIGMANTYVFFSSLALIPLSEITVICMVSPILTAAMSPFFFNEKFERVTIINGALSIIGVAFIAKPSFIFGNSINIEYSDGRTLGLILAIVSTFLGSTIPILIKSCGSITHPIAMSSYFGFITAFLTPIAMLMQGKLQDFTLLDARNLILSGMLGTIAHISMSTSFQYGEAGKIALLQYSQIIFAFVYDILIDNRHPDDYSVLGTAFILAGFFVLMYKTAKKSKEAAKSINENQKLIPLKT